MKSEMTFGEICYGNVTTCSTDSSSRSSVTFNGDFSTSCLRESKIVAISRYVRSSQPKTRIMSVTSRYSSVNSSQQLVLIPKTQLEREQILTNAMRHLSQEKKVELLFSLSKLEQYENESSYNDDSSVGSLSSTMSSLVVSGFLATQSKTTRRTIIKCLRWIGKALQVSEWRKNMAWQKHEMMGCFTLHEFLSTRLKIALSMEHTELLIKTFDTENCGEVNVYDLLEESLVQHEKLLQLVKKKKARENGILIEKGDTISGLYADGISMKVLNILRDASYKLVVSKRNDILGLPRRVIMNSTLFQEMLVDFGVLLTLRERKTLELRFCAGSYVHAGNVDFSSFKASFLFLGCEMLMGQGNQKKNNSMSRFVQAEITNEEKLKIQTAPTTTSTTTGQETTSVHNNNRHEDNNVQVGKTNRYSSKSNKSTLNIPSCRNDAVAALTSRESHEWSAPLFPQISTSTISASIETPTTIVSPSKTRVTLNELLGKSSRDQDEIPAPANKRQPRLSIGSAESVPKVSSFASFQKLQDAATLDRGPDTPRTDDDDDLTISSKELLKSVAVAPETEEEFPGHPDIAPSVTKSFNIRRSFENMDMLNAGQKNPNLGGGGTNFLDAIHFAKLALLDSEKMLALSNEPARDEDEGGDALYSLEKTKSGILRRSFGNGIPLENNNPSSSLASSLQAINNSSPGVLTSGAPKRASGAGTRRNSNRRVSEIIREARGAVASTSTAPSTNMAVNLTEPHAFTSTIAIMNMISHSTELMIREIQRLNAPSEPVGLTSEFHRRFSVESSRSTLSNLATLFAEDGYIDNSDADDDYDHDGSRQSSATVTPTGPSRRTTYDR